MATADEIRQAVLGLPEAEYAKVMDWLLDLADEAWDRQIEADAKAGRLDALAAEAFEAKARGQLRDLPDV
ncbi:MAG: hypothetical protein F4X80_00860 [Chloroflexi bacterium]|nr:hypothetical protein [Chloroflexota bacterium]MYE31226.1 hypothetical protein [Chloroflexota bacterium]